PPPGVPPEVPTLSIDCRFDEAFPACPCEPWPPTGRWEFPSPPAEELAPPLFPGELPDRPCAHAVSLADMLNRSATAPQTRDGFRRMSGRLPSNIGWGLQR